MRVLRDFLNWIARVVDQDLLRGNKYPDRSLESFDVKCAVDRFELQKIERRQIAGGIIQEQIFTAWIGGILSAGRFTGVPLMDRGIELHPRIPANVGAFANFPQ